MAGRPRLLLLDEPMAGLSHAERRDAARCSTSSIRDCGAPDRARHGHGVRVRRTGHRAPPGTGARGGAQGRHQRERRGAGDLSGLGRCTALSRRGVDLLDVADLHTYYGDSHVLQGVTLRVERGTVTAVLGRNGVGKTTLCRSLVGLTPARSGRMSFDGVETTRLPPHRICARNQSRAAGPPDLLSLTVRRTWRSAARGSSSERRVDRRSRLRRSFRGSPSAAITGQRAERRRAADAGHRARARRQPALLIMDEPTEGLAPSLVAEVGRLIGQLRRKAPRCCSSSRTPHSPSRSRTTRTS